MSEQQQQQSGCFGVNCPKRKDCVHYADVDNENRAGTCRQGEEFPMFVSRRGEDNKEAEWWLWGQG